LFVGLIILVNDATNLTDWFLSADDEPRTFNGLQISKINDSLSVSFTTGNGVNPFNASCSKLPLFKRFSAILV